MHEEGDMNNIGTYVGTELSIHCIADINLNILQIAIGHIGEGDGDGARGIALSSQTILLQVITL